MILKFYAVNHPQVEKEWGIPIGTPSQLTEAGFQALSEGQKGGHSSHLKGHDVA